VSRHILDLRKASVIYLLLAALLVEIDNLDALRIIEISYMRVIECNVTVLTDAQENHIDRMLLENPVIPLDLFLRITLRSDEFDARKRKLVEDGTAEEVTEALRCVGREIYIFIHV
jgi:hypothetical protein